MVFLNPSILLGLLAASIPILIHIINFRKLHKVEFSTLAFLKELQKSKIKKIKIKQWLLLLLRTLIIIFLVLAFARPTLESTYFSTETSTAKSSAAFIIDNSFSMSLIGDEGSVFNKSKTEAKKIISQMQNGDQFYFIISGDSIKKTTDKKTAISIIDKIKISFFTEPLNKKLDKANSELLASQNINKEIFLFSDFQKNTLNKSLLKDSTRLEISNKIKLYSFDMSIKETNNYSVSNLKLENSIIELNKQITFSVSVNNYSVNKVDNIVASLFVNDERVAQQTVSLLPNQQKKVKFETTLKSTGLVEAKVKLEDDRILQDNQCYTSFYIPEKIKILVIYDNIADIRFLKAAINSISTLNRFNTNFVKSTDNYNVELYDVIFLISTNQTAIGKTSNYISAGGKAVIIPSNTLKSSDLKNLYNKLNFPIAKSIIELPPNDNNYAEFNSIDFSHPILNNIFTSQIKNKIESPKIYKYIKLTPSQSTNKIISLNDKSIFLGEYNLRKGKVIFFNTAINLTWSNFPLKGIFAPLVNNIIHYLTSKKAFVKSYKVGDIIPLNIENILYPKIEVKLPIGLDNINVEGFKNKIYNYNSTLQPGNYKFYSNNKLIMFASVNTDPTESDLSGIASRIKNQIFKKYYEGNFININQKENYLATIKQSRYGTELWKPILLIAFLLALIEMFVARNTKKDLMTLDTK